MASNDDAEVPPGLSLWKLCNELRSAPSNAVLRSLIVKGADVNTKGANGTSVLHWAAYWGYLNAVETLLATEGINIDVKDNSHVTALMAACSHGHVEIVKALLEALKKTPRFDINDKTISGMTALIWSCMHSHVEITKLLLTTPRISTHLKSNLGLTALDHVEGGKNEDEIEALFQGKLLPSFLAADREHSLYSSLSHILSLNLISFNRCRIHSNPRFHFHIDLH
jgi:ankyrin repeat protein